jgi:alcohol dehydrogenase class IV
MMFAATLAGIGFGNSGVHVPHAMAYAVAGLVRGFRPPDYRAGGPIVPHGMSVILNAPAAFRFTAAADPPRHRDAARYLGAPVDAGAGDGESGELLAAHITTLMRQTGMPPDLAAVGYAADDIAALVNGTFAQQRLLANAPRAVDRDALADLFADALNAHAAPGVAAHG